MAKLNTINTIELSSLCNLTCSYCIQGQLKDSRERKAGLMPEDVFTASLGILKQLVERGTQREINLNGNGESLLHPDLIEYVRKVKEIAGPERQVRLTSNGLVLTQGIALALKDAGLDQLDLSVHSPKHVRQAVQIVRQVGLPGVLAVGAVMYPHDWAGQVDDGVKYIGEPVPCSPLVDGYGYIQSDGNISPCCYDFRHLGTFGTVFDADILDREYGMYALCDTCHQGVPADVPRGTMGHGSRVFEVAI